MQEEKDLMQELIEQVSEQADASDEEVLDAKVVKMHQDQNLSEKA